MTLLSRALRKVTVSGSRPRRSNAVASRLAVALMVRVSGGRSDERVVERRRGLSRARTGRCGWRLARSARGRGGAAGPRACQRGCAPAFSACAGAHVAAAEENRLRSSARSGCSITSATGPARGQHVAQRGPEHAQPPGGVGRHAPLPQRASTRAVPAPAGAGGRRPPRRRRPGAPPRARAAPG